MTDPLLDVIIPVHDRADWLELCLVGLKNFTTNPAYITIVDNASVEPATQAMFARAEAGEFGSARVVRLAENRSFSNSVNSGIRAGSAPNIVILNDDAIVTPGWDKHILQDLSDKKVGLVGARTNAAAGLQSDFVGISNVMDPPFLVFVCVAMRREVYDQVGPLDEECFDGFSAEDLDYSWSVKKHGGKLKVSNAHVLHGLSQTLSKTVGGNDARARNDAKYMARLQEKWGRDFVIENTRLKPRVMICTFSAEDWTRVDFAQNLFGLRRGTAFDLDMCWFRRLPIHMARQSACASILAMNENLRKSDQLPFTHLLMVDDDAASIPPDALMRLLGHKKDVVGVMAYQRGTPFSPCVFELSEDRLHVNPLDIANTGLRRVDAIGMHMTLFQVSVFEKLKEFYVEQAKAKGVVDREELQRLREKGKKFWGAFEVVGEDLKFCERAREAGVEIHCDTDLEIGHIGASQVVNGTTRKAWIAAQSR